MSSSSTTSSSKPATDFWDPTQYLLYDSFRSRPGVDLIERAIATYKIVNPHAADTSSVRSLVDLGCGTGKLALQLSSVFPQAKVEGVDSSANMLVKAREAASKSADASVKDRVSFTQARFEEYVNTTGADIIFSNAALHWSHEHATLFPYLIKQLGSNGILAVQIPNNFRAPSHTMMLKALNACGTFDSKRIDEIWSAQPNTHIDGGSYYWHLLHPYASLLDVWETTYMQNIGSTTKYHPVLEWTKSTALAPILDAFPDEKSRDNFQQIYSDLLEEHYPYFDSKTQPGKKEVLFPFRRCFILAVAK